MSQSMTEIEMAELRLKWLYDIREVLQHDVPHHAYQRIEAMAAEQEREVQGLKEAAEVASRLSPEF